MEESGGQESAEAEVRQDGPHRTLKASVILRKWTPEDAEDSCLWRLRDVEKVNKRCEN